MLLNPDAAPLPGCGEAIRRPWLEGRGWAAWQALVADSCGRGSTRRATRSTSPASSGPAPTGSRSARRRRRPRSRRSPGPASRSPARPGSRQAASPSASSSTTRTSTSRCACASPAGNWGSSRPRRSTTTTSSAPRHKWRWLERNRWALLIRIYPTRLLILVLPALMATELALIAVAFAGRLGRPEARRRSSTCSAGCRSCCASGARSRRAAKGGRRPSSPPGSPPSSTRRSSAAPVNSLPGAISPCAGTGAAGPPACAEAGAPRRLAGDDRGRPQFLQVDLSVRRPRWWRPWTELSVLPRASAISIGERPTMCLQHEDLALVLGQSLIAWRRSWLRSKLA